MPQMSPLWWDLLFILFFMIYMLFNIIIYFNYKKNMIKNHSIMNKSMHFNWLW
uniref:ATP synthase F0 subunit 8 n=1 Tax=Eurydema qinlingensis TaxID=1985868 RepID=A0A5C0CK57_9HEMI|nr:ATP synthase F0 subunit 8 [Eurydema qinlingensis]QEI26508.1 ATP synthase F0 subunit 8 [Eurydema qinlingensis]